MSEESPAHQDESRNPDGTFRKGFSGNPQGKPKGCVSLTSLLRKKLDEMREDGSTAADALIEATFRDALAGDAQARKLCWEYIDGKPTQPVEHGGEVTVIVDDVG